MNDLQSVAELFDIKIVSTIEEASFGFIVARGCDSKTPTAQFEADLAAEIENAKQNPERPETTKPVRELLRYGKYKPTGRGKPASEYLLRSAVQDKFPRVFPLVDICNLVSLRFLLPISLIDIRRAETQEFRVRRGRENESYEFNSVGQEIGLQDLLLVAKGPEDQPCANPVKDSMATKLDADATDVLAVIYGPPELNEVLQQATQTMADLLARDGGAEAVESKIE